MEWISTIGHGGRASSDWGNGWKITHHRDTEDSLDPEPLLARTAKANRSTEKLLVSPEMFHETKLVTPANNLHGNIWINSLPWLDTSS